MEKAIYYREHYYSLPNGTDFDRFKRSLPAEVEDYVQGSENNI